MFKLLFFFFFITLSFYQSGSVTGVISNFIVKPLESANVIAKSNYQVMNESAILVKNNLFIFS
ncbi:hypothetical protein IWX83_000081 [Flavobacterium sp. CG_9.1]|nr:hypothetical protein [Flavobacterium sp. CG_9.1]